jgi:hypothetical protein
MSKRQRSDVLTGGSGDVNPQIWHLIAYASAPATLTETAFSTPIARLSKSGNRITIMELLKVAWISGANPVIAAAGETAATHYCDIITRTNPGGTPGPGTPGWIDGVHYERSGAFTAAGTYLHSVDRVVIHDLTDGAGHGILLATDQLIVSVSGTQVTTAFGASVAIYYRFKDVDLSEYIGIVQSQQ